MSQLEMYKERIREYPFANELDNAIETFQKAANLPMDRFFEEILSLEDELLDVKEDIVDPLVTEFLQTDRFKIYEDIRKFVENRWDDLSEVADPRVNDLIAITKDPHPYRGKKLVQAKESYEAIKNILDEKLASLRQEALQKIDETIMSVQSAEGFDELLQESGNEQKHQVLRPLLDLKASIEQSRSIVEVQQKIVQTEKLYLEALDMIDEFLARNNPQQIAIIKERIPLKELQPPINRLKTKQDVEAYIKALEAKLLDAIDDGKEIVV